MVVLFVPFARLKSWSAPVGETEEIVCEERVKKKER